MAKAMERDLARIGWLDYLLMSFGSCLAVYSAGMSIQQPTIGVFSVVCVLVGSLVSYLIRIRTLRSPLIKWDGLVYSGAVIAAIYFSPSLSGLMPEGGFPREIAAAGWLSWMLILGSFATWQDATLLFQAIPSLALFGLVGCYDTYSFVTFNFFAFLICLATLFARAHGRQMLRQAATSGYFTRGLAPGTPIPSVETTPGLAMDLKRGPWRWVAGPEWALLSALGVVLLSLLGAPIIQRSVSGVAGLVKLTPPPMKNQPAAVQTGTGQTETSVAIGKGPNHLLAKPVLEATLDKPRYLRELTYQTYTGRGWQSPRLSVSGNQDSVTATDLGDREMAETNSFKFELTLVQAMKFVPVPPRADRVSSDSGELPLKDGVCEIGSVAPYETKVSGLSEEAASTIPIAKAVKRVEIKALVDRAKIPARVAQLAIKVAEKGKTDYEKANLISDEISRRITYNLDAAPTPLDKDPVEYALFESHEAYCDVYASAMVLMARSIGIPARYCQGYLPDNRRREESGVYLVCDQDYHAWAELLFSKVGWVTFDPTIGANSKEGEGVGDLGNPKPWYMRGFLYLLFDGMIAIVALGFAYVAFRGVRMRSRIADTRTEVEKVYALFARQLEKATGHRRRVGQTADEFFELARESLGKASLNGELLNQTLVKYLYSPNPIAEESVITLRADLKRFVRLLKAVRKEAKSARK